MSVTGTVVWSTGASSGIGEALAKEFAKRGAKLILSARRAAELERVRQACVALGAAADGVAVLAFDITGEDAMGAVVDDARARFGRLDLLINNAGISQRSLAVDTDMGVYRRIMEVDFFGQVALTKQVLPIMIEQGGGHIAVTASVAGKVGAPLRTGYCAAKHAVMGFFDALRSEVARHHIAVSTIVPGFIRTDISVHALSADGTAHGKMDADLAAGMDADAAARVIVAGLARRQPEIPVGKGREMNLLWMKRLSPKAVFRLVERVGGG